MIKFKAQTLGTITKLAWALRSWRSSTASPGTISTGGVQRRWRLADSGTSSGCRAAMGSGTAGHPSHTSPSGR